MPQLVRGGSDDRRSCFPPQRHRSVSHLSGRGLGPRLSGRALGPRLIGRGLGPSLSGRARDHGLSGRALKPPTRAPAPDSYYIQKLSATTRPLLEAAIAARPGRSLCLEARARYRQARSHRLSLGSPSAATWAGTLRLLRGSHRARNGGRYAGRARHLV